MNIEEVLTEIGYTLKNHGNYFTCRAVYRNGDNDGAIAIYPNKNVVIDFVTGEKFNIENLIAKTLGINNKTEIQNWINSRHLVINIEKPEPMLTEPKIFPVEWLNELKPDHSYWTNRGISEKTLSEFRGGVCEKEMMKNRYVIPVFDKTNNLIGLVGRTLVNSKIKYKVKGSKNLFRHPFNLNLKDIKRKREIILVEGQGCVLSLFEAGIRNCLCLFGVSLSNEQFSSLLALDLNKIIIATNRDQGPGIIAAEKLQKRLLKFFDRKQVEIRIPEQKDLNEVLQKNGVEGIKDWYLQKC